MSGCNMGKSHDHTHLYLFLSTIAFQGSDHSRLAFQDRHFIGLVSLWTEERCSFVAKLHMYSTGLKSWDTEEARYISSIVITHC